MSTIIADLVAVSAALPNLQPAVVRSIISDSQTPVGVFHKLSADAQTAFLFESAHGDSRLARFSFVGVDPLLTVVLRDGRAEISGEQGTASDSQSFEDPLAVLRTLMEQCQSVLSDNDGLDGLPFTGGLVGFMSYSAVRYFERISVQANDPTEVPDGLYGLYDSLIVFDHQYRRLHVISRRGDAYADALLARVVDGRSALPTLPGANLQRLADGYETVATSMSRADFETKVERCKDYMREGQVFQIVLSQRFSLPCEAPALDVYRVLQAINPSPYAYYLKFQDAAYIGSSPETFVRCNEGNMLLRAIAGTRPRGETAVEDDALATELKTNEKELAEHHMLVDLGRNDVGKMCTPGTVHVGEIAELIKYTHVMHLATEVRGTLADGKTSFDAFRSCFPRGTVSGAPKVRAMELLSTLEPERRGIYSGVVGYFDFKGNTDGAIAIRSVLVKNGIAHVNAGAGIVLDSDPCAEYEETRNKAMSVVSAVQIANKLSGGAQ